MCQKAAEHPISETASALECTSSLGSIYGWGSSIQIAQGWNLSDRGGDSTYGVLVSGQKHAECNIPPLLTIGLFPGSLYFFCIIF